MKIEPIIYETTRGLYNLEDKLAIASLILFCYKLGSRRFSELLYADNHEKFIYKLSNEFSEYEVDFYVKLEDKQIKKCFDKTIQKVIEKYDKDGYLKALHQGDRFALVIEGIVNYNFNSIDLKRYVKKVNEQLKLFTNFCNKQ